MASIAFMGMMTIGSAISGGLNADSQQSDIKQNCCQLAASMNSLNKSMAEMITTDRYEEIALQQKVLSEKQKIIQYQNLITNLQVEFKKTYTTWVVVASVFMIFLIFIFAVKKFLLHATTE